MNASQPHVDDRLLEATQSIAIHHGTFQLADEGPDDAARELKASGNLSFRTLANGESLTLSGIEQT